MARVAQQRALVDIWIVVIVPFTSAYLSIGRGSDLISYTRTIVAAFISIIEAGSTPPITLYE